MRCALLSASQVLPGAKLLGDILTSSRQYHSSPAASQESATPDVVKETLPQSYEPERKYRGNLADKELWHEAWMYEDRFGTEENPIFVPCLESERIIGVTDPEDDNLVVWGILRESEGPRQFIENGEYYVLKKVPYIMKVGDILDQLEAGSNKPLDK